MLDRLLDMKALAVVLPNFRDDFGRGANLHADGPCTQYPDALDFPELPLPVFRRPGPELSFGRDHVTHPPRSPRLGVQGLEVNVTKGPDQRTLGTPIP